MNCMYILVLMEINQLGVGSSIIKGFSPTASKLFIPCDFCVPTATHAVYSADVSAVTNADTCMASPYCNISPNQMAKEKIQ